MPYSSLKGSIIFPLYKPVGKQHLLAEIHVIVGTKYSTPPTNMCMTYVRLQNKNTTSKCMGKLHSTIKDQQGELKVIYYA